MVLGTWPGRGGTGRRSGHGAGGAKTSCPRDTLGHRARVFIAGGSGRSDRARAVCWYRRARGRRGRPTPPSDEDVARNLLRWYASSWSFLLGSKSPLGYLHPAPSSFDLGENEVIASHILGPPGPWALVGVMPSTLKIQETGKASADEFALVGPRTRQTARRRGRRAVLGCQFGPWQVR